MLAEHRQPRRARFALALALVLTLAACGETAIELRLNLNVHVPDELDGVCLALGPVGRTSFARHYRIDKGGAALTLAVLPGDESSERFEAIVSAELGRGAFQFERRVIEFKSGNVAASDFAVGGACSEPTGSGTFEPQRRLTSASTPPPVLAALPALNHAALVVAVASGGAPRFAWGRSSAPPNETTVVKLGGVDPVIGAGATRLIAFDMQSKESAGVCALDLLALTAGGPEIWQNNGSNAFVKATQQLPVSGVYLDAIARDLDGDGVTDLALVQPSGLTLLFGVSDGSFKRQNAREPAGLTDLSSIAVGYFDDPPTTASNVPLRTLDIVLGRTNGQKDVVLLNVGGDGDFSSPSARREVGPAKDTLSVTVARVNKDTADDIVATHGDSVSLLVQTSPGVFTPTSLNGAVNARDVARVTAPDVNGDCVRDLVLLRAAGQGDSVVLLRKVGGGYDVSPAQIPGGSDIVSVDFDGDGTRDLIVSLWGDGAHFYRQTPRVPTP